MRVNSTTSSQLAINANLLNLKAKSAKAAAAAKTDAAQAKAASAKSPNALPGVPNSAKGLPTFLSPAALAPAPDSPHLLDGEGNAGPVVCGISAGVDAPASPLTLQGFNDAWGQVSKQSQQYDLNADGNVDMDDLLAFINAQTKPANPDAPGLSAPATPATQIGAATELVASNQLTTATGATSGAAAEAASLDGILDAFGQKPNEAANAQDINNSGGVDMDDILQFINNMPTMSANGSQPSLAANPSTPTLAIAPGLSVAPSLSTAPGLSAAATPETANELAATSPATTLGSLKSLAAKNLQQLADSLIDRLGNAGFKDQPPTNIREIVDRLNLSATDSNSVLGKLNARWPQGLGVNVVA